MSYTYCHLCGQPATNHDQHHVARRSIGNRDNTVPLCRMCHNFVEANQTWAAERGFMDRHAQFQSEREFHDNDQ